MDVDFPQSVENMLSPPNFHNRLFIYTGTAFGAVPALGPRDDDNWTTDTVVVDLTRWHGGRVFNPATTIAIASASLASINGSDNASDSTWAVNKSYTAILPGTTQTPAGSLHLLAEVAVRGAGAVVWRIAYQVFIQTIGYQLLALKPPGMIRIPRGAPATFPLTVTVAAPLTTPEPISLLSDAGAVTFTPLTIAAGMAAGITTVTIPANYFPVGTFPLKITAFGPLDSQSIVVMVIQL